MDALRELTDRELLRVARVSFCPHWLCEANNEGFWAILLSNILWVIWGLHDRAYTPIFLFERSWASTRIVNVSHILTHSDAHLLDDCALSGLHSQPRI
jgi:hypothetical protein